MIFKIRVDVYLLNIYNFISRILTTPLLCFQILNPNPNCRVKDFKIASAKNSLLNIAYIIELFMEISGNMSK